jgi:hypothetical protein
MNFPATVWPNNNYSKISAILKKLWMSYANIPFLKYQDGDNHAGIVKPAVT